MLYAPPPADIIAVIEAERGPIPAEFLWSMAWGESRYDVDVVNRFGFIGLFQVGPVWLEPFNEATGSSFTRANLKKAKENTRVAVWALRHIAEGWARNHPESLATDWKSRRFLELLAMGYGHGYSERGGVGLVVGYLEDRSFLTGQITARTVHRYARAAGAVRFLSDDGRLAHSLSVVARVFENGAPAPSDPAPGRLRRGRRRARRRGASGAVFVVAAFAVTAAVALGRT